MKFRLAVVIVAAYSICGCEKHRDGMFSFDDPRLKQKLIHELAAEGIETSLDANGQIRFDSLYQTKVNEFAFRILDTTESSGATSGLNWPDERYTLLFIAELDRVGIEYKTSEKNGEITVRLSREGAEASKPRGGPRKLNTVISGRSGHRAGPQAWQEGRSFTWPREQGVRIQRR